LPSILLYDVRLSHLNKDYLLTYLLTVTSSPWRATIAHKLTLLF